VRLPQFRGFFRGGRAIPNRRRSGGSPQRPTRANRLCGRIGRFGFARHSPSTSCRDGWQRDRSSGLELIAIDDEGITGFALPRSGRNGPARLEVSSAATSSGAERVCVSAPRPRGEVRRCRPHQAVASLYRLRLG
jgi:hypothetical protein